MKLFLAKNWIMLLWVCKDREDVEMDSTNIMSPVLNPLITALLFCKHGL